VTTAARQNRVEGLTFGNLRQRSLFLSVILAVKSLSEEKKKESNDPFFYTNAVVSLGMALRRKEDGVVPRKKKEETKEKLPGQKRIRQPKEPKHFDREGTVLSPCLMPHD